MDFEQVVKKRFSVREYLDKEVPDKLILKILEIANLCPSAKNLQARSLIIVKDKEAIKKIAEDVTGQSWISQAPVVIAVFANIKESSGKLAFTDAVIFTSYLQLVATSLGLSTCWVGGFDENDAKKVLNIPDDRKLIALIPLGYANGNPARRVRKNPKELVIRQIK